MNLIDTLERMENLRLEAKLKEEIYGKDHTLYEFADRSFCGTARLVKFGDLLREARGMREEVARLTAENAKLREVVDKLPKTADGVSVVPGMTLFPPCGHKEFVTDGASCHTCCEGNCRDEDWGENDYHDVTYRRHRITTCFSTREAALAAKP